MYGYVLCAMCHVHAVPGEARRQWQIPWHWSYNSWQYHMGAGTQTQVTLEEQSVLLTAEPSLQSPKYILKV